MREADTDARSGVALCARSRDSLSRASHVHTPLEIDRLQCFPIKTCEYRGSSYLTIVESIGRCIPRVLGETGVYLVVSAVFSVRYISNGFKVCIAGL